MPRGASPKRERQYEHIKQSARKSGRYGGRAEEVAARTVNKIRREKGETQSQRSRSKKSSSKSGSRTIRSTKSRTARSRPTKSRSKSPAGAGRSRRASGNGRGFAGMSAQRQRAIAAQGGRAAHKRGTAHEFSPAEARQAGQKGGEVVSKDRGHMADIGRRGGER
jgi:general stress protein YciG